MNTSTLAGLVLCGLATLPGAAAQAVDPKLLQQTTNSTCRYDGWGELQKKPVGEAKPNETPQAMSKRPINRKKAETSDYVERAVSLVHSYLPPKPE